MVQLIAIGLVGGLVWYGYRAFKRQMQSVGEELKKTAEKAGADKTRKSVDALEQGPDGVYRPKPVKPDDNNEAI